MARSRPIGRENPGTQVERFGPILAGGQYHHAHIGATGRTGQSPRCRGRKAVECIRLGRSRGNHGLAVRPRRASRFVDQQVAKRSTIVLKMLEGGSRCPECRVV